MKSKISLQSNKRPDGFLYTIHRGEYKIDISYYKANYPEPWLATVTNTDYHFKPHGHAATERKAILSAIRCADTMKESK